MQERGWNRKTATDSLAKRGYLSTDLKEGGRKLQSYLGKGHSRGKEQQQHRPQGRGMPRVPVALRKQPEATVAEEWHPLRGGD